MTSDENLTNYTFQILDALTPAKRDLLENQVRALAEHHGVDMSSVGGFRTNRGPNLEVKDLDGVYPPWVGTPAKVAGALISEQQSLLVRIGQNDGTAVYRAFGGLISVSRVNKPSHGHIPAWVVNMLDLLPPVWAGKDETSGQHRAVELRQPGEKKSEDVTWLVPTEYAAKILGVSKASLAARITKAKSGIAWYYAGGSMADPVAATFHDVPTRVYATACIEAASDARTRIMEGYTNYTTEPKEYLD